MTRRFVTARRERGPARTRPRGDLWGKAMFLRLAGVMVLALLTLAVSVPPARPGPPGDGEPPPSCLDRVDASFYSRHRLSRWGRARRCTGACGLTAVGA